MKPMPPPGSRVAFYSRYSTALQNHSSIEGQERICEIYSQKHEWVETGRYSDAERSGTTTAGREGLFRMMAAAERAEFDVLLVEDIDRTSRDAADMHTIFKELDELDVTLCTVVNGVVTDMELAFKAVQNQAFIKQNAFKSKRGQELVVASGRMSGSVAYGYKKFASLDAKGEPINGIRELHPERAAVVRRIHEDFDAGKTTFEICKALNAEGVPSPKGKLWRPGSLLGNRNGGLGILRNPIYIGEYQFRKTHRKKRKGAIKMRFTEASERIFMQHPEMAIIDQAMWDRNQLRLAESFDRPFQKKKKGQFVFSGKVFCGKCNNPCIVSDGKFLCTGHNQMGVCDNGRRVFRPLVEDSIFSRMTEHVATENVLQPCLAAFREEETKALADHASRVVVNEITVKEIDQRIDNLMIQLGTMAENSITSQMVIKQLEELGTKKKKLDHQIKTTPRPVGQPLEDADIVARIRATLDGIQLALQGDDREAARARELMRGLVDRIVLTPAAGTVTDGRGAGDMTVTVEGPLAALIDLSDININRVTKHGHRPMFIRDNATVVWSFSYVLEWRNPRLGTVYEDLPILSKLLDEADVPVSMETFIHALAEAPRRQVRVDYVDNDERYHIMVDAPELDISKRSPAMRGRNAVAYLQAQGLTRCINLRSANSGYVWNDRGISDAAWKARVIDPPMTMALPPIRLSAPTAVVVTIGPRSVNRARDGAAGSS